MNKVSFDSEFNLDVRFASFNELLSLRVAVQVEV